MNERDCKNCANSKDGHINATETCHECMWENRFVSKQTIDNTRSENMTREEAIEELKGLKYDAYYDEEKEALDMAIKALEQESILDKPHIKGDYYDGFKNGLRTAEWRYSKIRAEIKHHSEHFINDDGEDCLALYEDDVIEIFEKYRPESEIEE